MTTEKVLKIKVGEVYIDGKSHTVYKTAWKVKDKDFYEVKELIFVNEVTKKDDKPKPTL